MKNLIVFLLASLSTIAFADQAATITCTGTKVILTEKSPYLGENSPFAQRLFTLKPISNTDETANTAYFLNLENTDISGPNNGKYGAYTVYSSAKNEVGGTIDLILSAWVDESDGTVIYKTAIGDISYSHGPLQGKNEKVKCVLE